VTVSSNLTRTITRKDTVAKKNFDSYRKLAEVKKVEIEKADGAYYQTGNATSMDTVAAEEGTIADAIGCLLNRAADLENNVLRLEEFTLPKMPAGKDFGIAKQSEVRSIIAEQLWMVSDRLERIDFRLKQVLRIF
jgi:hypothetical protein